MTLTRVMAMIMTMNMMGINMMGISPSARDEVAKTTVVVLMALMVIMVCDGYSGGTGDRGETLQGNRGIVALRGGGCETFQGGRSLSRRISAEAILKP